MPRSFVSPTAAGIFFCSSFHPPTGFLRSDVEHNISFDKMRVPCTLHSDAPLFDNHSLTVAVSPASAASSAAGVAGLVPHVGWASPASPGCALQALVSKPYSLTWHRTGEYWLAAYGPDDYVTV